MKNESKTSDFTYDYKCNIITLGDSTVGKTSLLCQYLAQKNPLKQVSTVGIDYFTKDIKIKIDESSNNENFTTIRVKIWDTAGQERYRSITDNFFKNSNGIMLVYDISCRETFDNLKEWVQSINLKVSSKEIKKILIGNKLDLERDVEKEEAETFAKSQNLEYFETSAKDNNNVKESIEYLVKQIYLSNNCVKVSKALNNSNTNNNINIKNTKKIKNNSNNGSCCK